MSTETEPQQAIRTFKIVVVGDGSVGKTTFIKRHKTGEFEKMYWPTIGVEVHHLKFYTNVGPVGLNIWDCAGTENLGGLRDGYYIDADAAIVMFSLTDMKTLGSVPAWIKSLRRVNEKLPLVLTGNKTDRFQDDEDGTNTFVSDTVKEHGLHYYSISAKSNYNFEKPFLYLIRQLLGDDSIRFVESPAQSPPTVSDLSNVSDTSDQPQPIPLSGPIAKQHRLLDKGIRQNRRVELMETIREALDELDALNEEDQNQFNSHY